MAKYDEVQTAADNLVNAIMQLPEDERGGWISYFFEGLEGDKMNTEVLELSKSIIENRLENGGW